MIINSFHHPLPHRVSGMRTMDVDIDAHIFSEAYARTGGSTFVFQDISESCQ